MEVDSTTEFRHRDPILDAETLGMLIRQSGESADTLAAQREMTGQGRADNRDLQRSGIDGDAPSAPDDLYTRGAGDRNGFDEGVYGAAGGPAPFRSEAGAGAGTIPDEESRRPLEELNRLPGKIEEIFRTCEGASEPLARTYRCTEIQRQIQRNRSWPSCPRHPSSRIRRRNWAARKRSCSTNAATVPGSHRSSLDLPPFPEFVTPGNHDEGRQPDPAHRQPFRIVLDETPARS